MNRKTTVKAGLYIAILLMWGCCSWKVSRTTTIEYVGRRCAAVDSVKVK